MQTSERVPAPRSKAALRRWLKLALAFVFLAVLWLGIFPLIASLPSVARHIETQQQLGIDPSAKFYTELEIAPAIAHNAERRQSQHGWVFWSGSTARPK